MAWYTDIWKNGRYYRYKIRTALKNLGFHSLINKWIAVSYLLIFIALGILYFTKNKSFGVLSPENYSGIIENFLRINSVLVGVIISLLILTFRVLNENYGTFAFRAIFKSKYNRILISLFLFNFFLTLYTLSYWAQNTVDTYYHALFWVSLSSNSILLCLSFPFAFLSLKSASHTSNIDAIIDSLNPEWIAKYETNKMNHPREVFTLKENPIEELTQISRKAIASEDYEAFRKVSDKLYGHMVDLASEDKNYTSFFFSEYSTYIKNLFTGALKSEDTHFTYFLVNKRIQLEQFLLELTLPKDQNPVWKTQLHYLSIDFEPFIHKSALVEDEAHLEEVLRAYFRIAEYYIQKVIPKELPTYEYEKFTEYSDVKFFISNFYGTRITSIAERLGDLKNFKGFKSLFTLFALQSTVLESTASSSVKQYLIHVLETTKRDSYRIYVDLKPSRISFLFFPFSANYVFEKELKLLDRFQTLNGLLWACDCTLQGGLLNNMILNQLKASILGLIRLQVKEKLNVKKPFIRCLEEYDKLRHSLQDRSHLHDQDMYVKIHEYLIFLENQTKDQGMLDDELKDKFLAIRSQFTNLDVFQKNLEESHYLRDESIT